MPNTILTPNIFLKLTLMNLGGSLSVCRNMSKELDNKFGKPSENTHKPGDTINVMRPQRFLVTKGLGYQPQPIANTKVSVTVDQVAGVHFEWDSVQRTLELREVNELYAKPAAIALAHQINSEAATFIAQNTFNSVGTPGTTPNSIDTYLSAGDKIIQLGLPPEEELNCIISRRMSSAFVSGNKALFNPVQTLTRNFNRGEVSDNPLGYTWHRDQTLYTHQVGAWSGTPLLNGANQTVDGGNNATMSLITNGWGSGVTTLNKGDVFTIGTDAAGTGVHSVHPQTRVSTGDLQQFTVVNQISDTTGAITMLVFPAITASGQYQNVDIVPVSNAAITMNGASGVNSPQGLLMHKNAFAFVSVPLENPDPKGVEMVSAQTDPDTGISLAFIRAFDPIARKHVNRFDCLYGFGRLYAEMACRISAGSATT